MAFWLASCGKPSATDDGLNIAFNPAAAPPPPPDSLKKVLAARSLIDDPAGAAAVGVAYADPLPDAAAEGSIWTDGSGGYRKMAGGAWEASAPILSDAAVLACGSARAALQRILASVSPRSYLTGFSAGGQSASYPSYADFRRHFMDLMAAADAAENTAGGAARFRRPPLRVGGER